MSAKDRMLSWLSKKYGQNTFTTEQARTRFHIWNVSARVYELREEGWPIETDVKVRNGRKVFVYSMMG